jgi:hypothetical protein
MADTQKGNIIAAKGSLAALLIGTGFAFFYTEMKVKIFDNIGGALPVPCLLFHQLTLPALFVPIIFAAAFCWMIKRQKFDHVSTAVFVTASSLFTLSWVLACLLVWELPNVPVCGSL